MQFQISTELIEKIQFLIEERNDEELLLHLEEQNQKNFLI